MSVDIVHDEKIEITSNEDEGPKLENWFYFGDKDFPYTCLGKRISGNVYNHSRFKDGTLIYTSGVEYINKTYRIAKTHNTTYMLIGPERNEPLT